MLLRAGAGAGAGAGAEAGAEAEAEAEALLHERGVDVRERVTWA